MHENKTNVYLIFRVVHLIQLSLVVRAHQERNFQGVQIAQGTHLVLQLLEDHLLLVRLVSQSDQCYLYQC